MQEERGREMRLIYHIVEAGKPITSTQLSELVSVSPRTIKSDMNQVREILSKVGAELISTKSLGYSIKITQDKLFRPFYDQVMYNRVLLGNIMNDRMTRFIFIARTLVASENYIRLDDLADAMYLSRSAIKSEIKLIYSFFNSFHLQIDSKIGQGIKVIGSEDNLRLAMTELVVNHYHKIKVSDSSKEFAKILECSEEERQAIRHTFLKVYRESGDASTDDETLRFAFYLLIMRNRIRANHHVVLSDDLKDEVRQLHEYPLTVKIVKALESCDIRNLSEDEVAQIAILLHGIRDIQCKDVVEGMPYLEDAREVAEDIVQSIKDHWEIDFGMNDDLINSLCSTILPILGQVRFGLSAQQTIGFTMTSHEISGSPLSIELGRNAMRIIEDKFYCRLNSKALVRLSFCFYSALISIHYDIRKLRLLTVSMAGKEAASGLARRIQHHFDRMIESNTPVGLYEVRGLDPSDYDCVIMNSPEFSYNYQIPFFAMDTVSRPRQFTKLFDEVLINAYQFRQYLPMIGKTEVYQSFQFESISAMFKFLSVKHGKDQTQSSLLEAMLIENEKFVSYNSMDDIISIFLPYTMCKENCIEIYELNEPKLWGRSEITKIVVYVTDFANSPQKTKAIENISRMMVVTDAPMKALLERPDLEIYAQMIKDCLTSE